MQVRGREAQVEFPLNLKERQPEHQQLSVAVHQLEGESNSNPTMYRIEVIRDLPPEVAFVEPKVDPKQEIPLAERGSLRLVDRGGRSRFQIATGDAARALRSEPLVILTMAGREEDGRAGKFRTSYLFTAKSERYALRAGELVELWAEAEDNKTPEPNRTETPISKSASVRRNRSRTSWPMPATSSVRRPTLRRRTAMRISKTIAISSVSLAPRLRTGPISRRRKASAINRTRGKSNPIRSRDGAPSQDSRVDPDDPGKVYRKAE